MTGFIIALLLLGLYWTLLYRGVSLAVFTGVTAAVVVALAATGLIGPVGFVITALVLGLGLALFNIVPLRTSRSTSVSRPRWSTPSFWAHSCSKTWPLLTPMC